MNSRARLAVEKVHILARGPKGRQLFYELPALRASRRIMGVTTPKRAWPFLGLHSPARNLRCARRVTHSPHLMDPSIVAEAFDDLVSQQR